MARREERAYREYVSDEQRSQPRGPQRGSRVGVEEGCPARELCDESLIRDTEVRSRCFVTVNVLHTAAELSTTLRLGGFRRHLHGDPQWSVRAPNVRWVL